MYVRQATHRPIEVQVALNDGTIDAGSHLIKWVQRLSPKQRLEVGKGGSKLVLTSPDETYDLYEGWWLVFVDDRFTVMDPIEFDSKYLINGE